MNNTDTPRVNFPLNSINTEDLMPAFFVFLL